jgi:hypothetical protein
MVDAYFAAYARHAQTAHPETGQTDLVRLLGFTSPDIRYEDVAAEQVFIGHDGVRAMGHRLSKGQNGGHRQAIRPADRNRSVADTPTGSSCRTKIIGTSPAI